MDVLIEIRFDNREEVPNPHRRYPVRIHMEVISNLNSEGKGW